MRTLKFVVDGQIIKQDPNCDFSGLVPGTEGYLQAEFLFTPEWNDCVKVAAFYSMMGVEYDPQILSDNNTCTLPTEALKLRNFKIQVVGKGQNKTLTTNKVTVSQNGGKS